MKIYHRYRENPADAPLLPQKRGSKFKTGRVDLSIEEKILSLRKLGNNRYEIREILRSEDRLTGATTIQRHHNIRAQ